MGRKGGIKRSGFLPERFYSRRPKRVLRWRWRLLLAGLLLLFVVIIHRPVLVAMGQWLAVPSGDTFSDAVLIEGGHTLSALKVEEGLKLLRSGRTNHLLLTLNTQDGWVDAFALSNYEELVQEKMEELGIPDSAFSIHKIEVRDPFTYNTARQVLRIMKDMGWRSLTIIQDNFHNRRSYLTYKKLMEGEGITVYPATVQIYVTAENWWKSGNGIRRVFAEYIKLVFYKLSGYI